MSASKTSLAFLILIGTLLFAGCSQNASKGEGDACSIESAGKKVFSGTPECLAQFKTEQMSGYWLVDFETSLFFPTKKGLERGSIGDAYSLNFLDAPPDEVSALLGLPREKVFRVSFEGSKSEVPGIYGALADLRGGVVVKDNFTIEGEIGDVPSIR